MTTPSGSDPSNWSHEPPPGGWPAPGQGQPGTGAGVPHDQGQPGQYPPLSGEYPGQTAGYPGYGDPYAAQPAYPGGYPTAGYPTAGYPATGYPPDASAPFGYDAQGRPYSDKQKLIAGLLQILLGGFGVGRFYTGHTGIGIAQIAVTIVTCGIGALWGLIDGIMILVNGGTDAQGRPLREN